MTMEVRLELATGELADRRDPLFSVCRKSLCTRLGESIITASTGDVDETPDKRRDSGSSWAGQLISSRNRSIEELFARLEVDGSFSLSRKFCSRIKEALRFNTSSVSFSVSV